MPSRVLLLRHAETTQPHTYNGAESDVGLSELGRRQSVALAPVLAARRPDIVVSSAMRRAIDTATVLASAASCPHLIEPDLHERRVGAFNGKTHEEIAPLFRSMVQRWIDGDVEYATEGAESVAAVRRRVVPVWERLTRTHEGRTLTVVAHGNILKILLLTILPGWSLADWDRFGRIPNLSLTELEGSPGDWRVVCLNRVDEALQGLSPPSNIG